MQKSYENSMTNSLLTSLPAREISQIIPHLQPVSLVAKKIVYRVGDCMTSIYFPCGGLVTENVVLADGGCFEIMSIGREGAFGIAALIGAEISAHEVTIEMPGPAWRISTASLKRILLDCPVLSDKLSYLFKSSMMQVAQTAVSTARSDVVRRSGDKPPDMREKWGNASVH